VHEVAGDEERLHHGHEQGDENRELHAGEVDGIEAHRDHSSHQQGNEHEDIDADVPGMVVGIVGTVGIVGMLVAHRRMADDRLEEIKHREKEDPDQVDEVPEQAGDLDAVDITFRVRLPHLGIAPDIKDDDGPGQDVQAVQGSEGEIERKIGAVSRDKGGKALDVVVLISTGGLWGCSFLACAISLATSRNGRSRLEGDGVDLLLQERLGLPEIGHDRRYTRCGRGGVSPLVFHTSYAELFPILVGLDAEKAQGTHSVTLWKRRYLEKLPAFKAAQPSTTVTDEVISTAVLKVPMGMLSNAVRPVEGIGANAQENIGGEQAAEEHDFGGQEQPDADLGVVEPVSWRAFTV
jgi:hypothetical protein